MLASAVTAALALRLWAHMSVREREREGRRMGTEGNDDTISFWSHVVGIENGERGRRQWTEVIVSALE